jgi:hypothetical protein
MLHATSCGGAPIGHRSRWAVAASVLIDGGCEPERRRADPQSPEMAEGQGLRAGFGVAGQDPSSVATVVTNVWPTAKVQPDGATRTTYNLPDGSVMVTINPPASFNPLTAGDSALNEYGFPLASSDPNDLEAWTAAMTAYKSDDPPTGALRFVSDAAPGTSNFTTYTTWGGYTVGTWQIHSHTYVAVKDITTVASNTGTCDNSAELGFWIGLGGTTGNADLVQHGFECGNTDVGSGYSYRPFTEFAFTAHAMAFCGYSSWTVALDDVIYQNMSFQTSSNTAYFYFEDETSGVTHSCSRTPPPGWSWDLNTSEWVGEAPKASATDFHSVPYSDARTELSSNSTWVTLASQAVTKVIDGLSSAEYCIYPSNIGSDGASFTNYWHQAACGVP